MSYYNYLGKGIQFPLVLDSGRMATVTGKPSVEQSIFRLLTTPIGETLNIPEYGSNLHKALFEPNDTVLENLIYVFVKDAIEKWEKRVKFVGIVFERNNEELLCNIEYRVLSSNEIDSFVFPFYTALKY